MAQPRSEWHGGGWEGCEQYPQLLPGLRGRDRVPCSGSNAFPRGIFVGKVVLLFVCHKVQEEVPGREPGISALSPQSRERPISPSVRPATPTALRHCLCSPGQQILCFSGSSVPSAPVIHTGPNRRTGPFSRSCQPCTSSRILSNFNHFWTKVRIESPGVLSQGQRSKIPLWDTRTKPLKGHLPSPSQVSLGKASLASCFYLLSVSLWAAISPCSALLVRVSPLGMFRRSPPSLSGGFVSREIHKGSAVPGRFGQGGDMADVTRAVIPQQSRELEQVTIPDVLLELGRAQHWHLNPVGFAQLQGLPEPTVCEQHPGWENKPGMVNSRVNTKMNPLVCSPNLLQ